jgi:Cys-rich repeat protein
VLHWLHLQRRAALLPLMHSPMRTLRPGPVIVTAVLSLTAAIASCSEVAFEATPRTGGAGTGSSVGADGGQAGSPGSTGGSAAGAGTPTAGSSSGTAGEGGSIGSNEGGVGGAIVMPPCGGNCPSDRSVCDEPNDTCVQCLQSTDCTSGAKKKCDTGTDSCFECLAQTDCASAASARCDQGACVKCMSNDD